MTGAAGEASPQSIASVGSRLAAASGAARARSSAPRGRRFTEGDLAHNGGGQADIRGTGVEQPTTSSADVDRRARAGDWQRASTEAGSSDTGERVSGAPTPLDLSQRPLWRTRRRTRVTRYLVVGERCRVQRYARRRGATDPANRRCGRPVGVAGVGRFVYVTDRDRDRVRPLAACRPRLQSGKGALPHKLNTPFFVMPAPTLSLIVLPRHPRPVIPAPAHSPSPSHPRPRPRCARRGRRARRARAACRSPPRGSAPRPTPVPSRIRRGSLDA